MWSPAEIETAQARCTAILKTIDAVTLPQPPIKEGKCGAPAPIRLVSLGKEHRATFDPPALVNCELAAALSQWLDKDVQPLALKHLGSRVAKLEIMSDYACRASAGRVHNRLSEHAYADAVDIGSFVTETGKRVQVLDMWGETLRDVIAKAEAAKAEAAKAEAAKAAAEKSKPESAAESEASKSKDAVTADAKAGDKEAKPPVPVRRKAAHGTINLAAARLGGPSRTRQKDGAETVAATAQAPSPTTPQSRFLHEAHATACRIFGTTLGPEANEDHRNHFHVDMAERKFKRICD